MPRIPKLFKNARVYYGDGELLIGSAKFTLPELGFIVEENDGFGFGGKHKVNTGLLEPMDFKLSFRTAFREAFVLAEPITHSLTFRGDVLSRDQEGAKNVSYPFEVQVSAEVEKFPLGDGEIAKAQDTEIEMTAYKLRVVLDGNEMMDIDIHQPKLVINGTDYQADMRSHMGMS